MCIIIIIIWFFIERFFERSKRCRNHVASWKKLCDSMRLLNPQSVHVKWFGHIYCTSILGTLLNTYSCNVGTHYMFIIGAAPHAELASSPVKSEECFPFRSESAPDGDSLYRMHFLDFIRLFEACLLSVVWLWRSIMLQSLKMLISLASHSFPPKINWI